MVGTPDSKLEDDGVHVLDRGACHTPDDDKAPHVVDVKALPALGGNGALFDDDCIGLEVSWPMSA